MESFMTGNLVSFPPIAIMSIAVILCVTLGVAVARILLLKKRMNRIFREETTYRFFFNESVDAQIMIVDDRIVACNPAALRMWGAGEEMVIGRNPGIFPPSHQPDGMVSSEKALIMIHEALREGRKTFEWLYNRSDGGEIWTEIALTAVKLGGKDAIVASLRDITSRKRMEEAQNLKEKRLRQIIDLVPHFIFAKDMDGRFILVNRAVADNYGTTVDELIGRTDADFARSSSEALHFHEDDMEVINSGRAKHIPDEEITDAYGKVHVLSTIKIPFTYSGTDTPAILGVSQDITERKKAEQSLKESEEKFRILVENISEVIFSMDTSGLCTYVSPVVTRHLGYMPADIMGRSFRTFVHPDDIPGIEISLGKTLSGIPGPYEFRVIAHDGSIRSVVTSSTLMTRDGIVTGLIGVMADITDLKKHEESFLQAASFRRALLDQSDVGIMLASTDRIILEANNRACGMFGYSLEELKGQSFRIIHPSDENFRDMASSYDELREKGQVIMERPFRKRDGTILWCSTSGTFLEPSDPSKGVIWTIVDVTDRHNAMEEIRASQQRLSHLVEQTILAVIEWDLDFRVTAWNQAAERIFGYSREEAIGHTCEELILVEGTGEKVKETWAALLANRGGARMQNENRTRDGRIIICEWYNSPIVDESGTVRAVASMADDITEQRKTESALEETKEKLEALVGAAQDAIVLIDSQGHITLWNRSASRIFGYDAGEVMGRTLQDILVPVRMRATLGESFSRFWQKGRGFHTGETMEISALRKGGEEFPVELSLATVGIGGHTLAVGIVRDITERIRTRDAMEEANRRLREATDALSYQACHDPLTDILNRRAILEILEKEIARAQRQGENLCLGIFDLDHFKIFNDRYGHQTGDDVLQGFVRIVSSHLREYDHVGRYGGEEFLVITPGCGRHDAEELYVRLCRMVAETPIPTRSGDLRLTVSGGVSDLLAGGSVDTLLAGADKALYGAKASGRDMVVFTWETEDGSGRTPSS